MENENEQINVNTALFGYNKKQTNFEVDRLKTRIKILEGDVDFLKNNLKQSHTETKSATKKQNKKN